MRGFKLVLLTAALAATAAPAQDRPRLFKKGDWQSPPCVPCPPAPTAPLDPNAPLTRPGEQPSTAPSPFQEALASAQESGTQPSASRNPGMFGDFIGSIETVVADVRTSSGIQTHVIRSIDVTQAGGLKVAESDSPAPQNRVYYNYNMYGAIPIDPDPSVPLLDVHRHIVGIEKTFLDGDASVGLRIPFFSFAGSDMYETAFAGDLNILVKFALIQNRQTGNVLSTGLVVTAPTGGSPHFFVQGVQVPSPRYFPVNLEPWGGYVYNLSPRLYVHGFHGVVIPTDVNEPTYMTNDVGLGFWLYRDLQASFIQAIVPTVEIHVDTPFDHRENPGRVGSVQMLDSVNLTSGFYVVLPRSTFGGAVGVPLAFGPHRIEAVASVTLRF